MQKVGGGFAILEGNAPSGAAAGRSIVAVDPTLHGIVIADNGGSFVQLQPATESALTLANGNNNNITCATDSVYIGGPTGAYAITGIAAGVAKREILFWTNINQTLTVSYEDAASTAANRLWIGGPAGPASLVLVGLYHSFRVRYSAAASRWIVIAST